METATEDGNSSSGRGHPNSRSSGVPPGREALENGLKDQKRRAADQKK